MKTVVDKLNGGSPPKRLDLNAVVIRKRNLDDPTIQRLLSP